MKGKVKLQEIEGRFQTAGRYWDASMAMITYCLFRNSEYQTTPNPKKTFENASQPLREKVKIRIDMNP